MWIAGVPMQERQFCMNELSCFQSIEALWPPLIQEVTGLGNLSSCRWWRKLVTQLCPTFCDPMDAFCSPLGSSVHGILQARILESVAISFSRGSSWPRDGTQVSHIAGRFFTDWAPREAPIADTIQFLYLRYWSLSYKERHYRVGKMSNTDSLGSYG